MENVSVGRASCSYEWCRGGAWRVLRAVLGTEQAAHCASRLSR